ncbi:MAG: DUF721 domain-containing protein [Alphaproteobacteria bacterium]|mgnify:CR=1 FL=1|nr:DUF721 domain-containing protein [Alphaproteobacteria bacterium]
MARSSRDTQSQSGENSQGANALARHRRVVPVASDAGRVGVTAFTRAGFVDPSLVLRWRDIAGPEVARLAQPVRLADGPSGGTLTLRAVPGAALFLGHEKRALCERINAYLGRLVVAQIKFSQGAPIVRPSPPTSHKPACPLPPSDPSRRYQGPEGLARALQALARRRLP